MVGEEKAKCQGRGDGRSALRGGQFGFVVNADNVLSPFRTTRIRLFLSELLRMMRLKQISLLRQRVTEWGEYPFNIPAIASLDALEINSRVCFFVGENGTGKSTLLEATAFHYGFGLEGGNRNFSPNTTASVKSIEPLVGALRLSFTKKTGNGFYLSADSFFKVASHVDSLGASQSYGGKSLHDQSHGESFISLLQNRFT